MFQTGMQLYVSAPPETPSLTPLVHQGSNQKEQDPFLIELGWTAVANASLYIVEFFPRNRQAKPGETNFFQVVSSTRNLGHGSRLVRPEK